MGATSFAASSARPIRAGQGLVGLLVLFQAVAGQALALGPGVAQRRVKHLALVAPSLRPWRFDETAPVRTEPAGDRPAGTAATPAGGPRQRRSDRSQDEGRNGRQPRRWGKMRAVRWRR